MVGLSRLFRSSFRHLLTLVLAALKNPWMQNQMKNFVVSLDGSDNGVGLPYRPFWNVTVRQEHGWWGVSLLWRPSNGFQPLSFPSYEGTRCILPIKL
jgi:hypothetical protein